MRYRKESTLGDDVEYAKRVDDDKPIRGLPAWMVDDIVDEIQEIVPDDAQLAFLSLTGSRAFGWGGDRHDMDVHGVMFKDGWYTRFYYPSQELPVDCVIDNLWDRDDWRFRDRFKKYYDWRNAFWSAEWWDHEEDLLGRIEVEHVSHVIPNGLERELQRYKTTEHTRAALHTYKEILVVKHYLETGDIEPNVVSIADVHDVEHLQLCAKKYETRDGSIEIPVDAVIAELEELLEQTVDLAIDAIGADEMNLDEERWS